MKILKAVMPILVIILVVGTGGAGYFYYQYHTTQQEILGVKNDPATAQKSADEEIRRVVALVGKLVELPTGETPTLATIADASKLQNEPLFQEGKNGDKVLIYSKAKKAILYDPVKNKVIDIAPVNIGSPSAQTTEARIAILNGTTVSGLTEKMEALVRKSYPQVNITIKGNASKNNYDKSVVVALNTDATEAAAKLSKAVNISAGDLLVGEVKPENADLLIIIGKDYQSQ